MTKESSHPDYTQILKEASSGRAGLVSIFGDSFFVTLSIGMARVRKLFRKCHLDINIPRLLIMLIFGGTAAWMIQAKTYNESGQIQLEKAVYNYELIKDIGTLFLGTVTVIFALNNMHREYHYKKRAKSSEYVKSWHSSELLESRRAIDDLKNKFFWDKCPIEFDKDRFKFLREYGARC